MVREIADGNPNVQRIETTDPSIDDQHALYTTCATVITQPASESDDSVDTGTEAGPRSRIHILDRHDNTATVTGRVNHAENAVLVTNPASTPGDRGLRGIHLLDNAYGDKAGNLGTILRIDIDADAPEAGEGKR